MNKNHTKFDYFFLKNILIGTPVNSNFSLILFSRYLLYGSFTYWGRLQKNAKAGVYIGSCVTYLILTYLPFNAGGGLFLTTWSITSFNSEVVIFLFLLVLTCSTSSRTL